MVGAVEDMHALKKRPHIIAEADQRVVRVLLCEMFGFFRIQVEKYRDLFVKNRPPGALMGCIYMLRMVFKDPSYQSNNDNNSNSNNTNTNNQINRSTNNTNTNSNSVVTVITIST